MPIRPKDYARNQKNHKEYINQNLICKYLFELYTSCHNMGKHTRPIYLCFVWLTSRILCFHPPFQEQLQAL